MGSILGLLGHPDWEPLHYSVKDNRVEEHRVEHVEEKCDVFREFRLSHSIFFHLLR